jgi:hypothetical protein
MPRILASGLACAALLVIGCSARQPPSVTPDEQPQRGLRDLAGDEAELSSIALAASQKLPPPGSPQPAFGGVYVNGRYARHASDAVARAVGYATVQSTRAPKVAGCRVVSSTGQSKDVPCPASVQQAVPTVFSFREVRATADSAYVGITESGPNVTRDNCVTLWRTSSGWIVLRSAVVSDAKRCGR